MSALLALLFALNDRDPVPVHGISVDVHKPETVFVVGTDQGERRYLIRSATYDITTKTLHAHDETIFRDRFE